VKDFAGKMAVVTGGGTGMGRELVCQLIQAGANVAMCDVSKENMQKTEQLAKVAGEQRLTSHICDVSEQAQLNNFRDEVLAQHQVNYINLLFNNAGIGGGGSFVAGDEAEWERTFAVCWYGVYYGCRSFMPALLASSEGHIINTSSINGFWASIGIGIPHTSYAAAKFAVKGFTEALITDLKVNAPHVKCSVVMPGHIGTSIGINTSKVLGKNEPMDLTTDEVDGVRQQLLLRGMPVGNVPDEHIRQMLHQRAIDFRDKAPTSAAQASTIILDGVREERWRILVGDDAHVLDQLVREAPEEAYEESMMTKIRNRGHLDALIPESSNESE
jgi:NAD(P)-dependent dehydrogenase (short-subunit alcohol dehydrogenase family)